MADWHASPRSGAPPQRMGVSAQTCPCSFLPRAPASSELELGFFRGPAHPSSGQCLGVREPRRTLGVLGHVRRVSGCIPAGPHACSSILPTFSDPGL